MNKLYSLICHPNVVFEEFIPFFGHYVVEDKLNSDEKARKTKPEKTFMCAFAKIEEIFPKMQITS